MRALSRKLDFFGGVVRILAIGGAGFLGRQVVGRLVAQGHVVHVPTRQFQHGRNLLVHPTVTVMQADIHDDAVWVPRNSFGTQALISLNAVHGEVVSVVKA